MALAMIILAIATLFLPVVLSLVSLAIYALIWLGVYMQFVGLIVWAYGDQPLGLSMGKELGYEDLCFFFYLMTLIALIVGTYILWHEEIDLCFEALASASSFVWDYICVYFGWSSNASNLI